MIALIRRALSWLQDCRVAGCQHRRTYRQVCPRHHATWRRHVEAIPIWPVGARAWKQSLDNWVRMTNEQKEGR